MSHTSATTIVITMLLTVGVGLPITLGAYVLLLLRQRRRRKGGRT
jgi:uncharacterized protein (TIGR03382 family)